MQEPKVGQLVTSRAGRDKDKKYLIVRLLEAPFVLVADGLVRGVKKPKKKNIKHLILHSKVAEEISGCPAGE
ncbi:MAG: RNA-binding protein, partial [Bacillota bacterium]|nr:RNA-binding protein [Bacillota bacterium]